MTEKQLTERVIMGLSERGLAGVLWTLLTEYYQKHGESADRDVYLLFNLNVGHEDDLERRGETTTPDGSSYRPGIYKANPSYAWHRASLIEKSSQGKVFLMVHFDTLSLEKPENKDPPDVEIYPALLGDNQATVQVLGHLTKGNRVALKLSLLDKQRPFKIVHFGPAKDFEMNLK